MSPVTLTQPDAAVVDFLQTLSGRVSGDLRRDDITRLLYSTDASIYQVVPHAVLIPRTEEDVHAAVELVHAGSDGDRGHVGACDGVSVVLDGVGALPVRPGNGGLSDAVRSAVFQLLNPVVPALGSPRFHRIASAT